MMIKSRISNQQSAICNLKSPSGVTLLELLIATSIFVFLCGLLAGLLGVALNLWKTGEKRGDLYDRAQMILEQLRADLDSVYVEKETSHLVKSQGTSLPDYIAPPEPSFYMDIDPHGNHWFYLVRVPEGGFYDLTTSTPTKKLERVLYYVKQDSTGENSLMRLSLSKEAARDFWLEKTYQKGIFPLPGEAALNFKNILYLGMSALGESSKMSKWNSLPPEASLSPVRTGRGQDSPDSIIIPEQLAPGAVAIEVVIAPSVFRPAKILLNAGINSDSLRLAVTSTKGLPAPPDYLKIGQEWMFYTETGFNTITLKRRGVRHSRATAHLKGEEVIYGETIKRVYYLPR